MKIKLFILSIYTLVVSCNKKANTENSKETVKSHVEKTVSPSSLYFEDYKNYALIKELTSKSNDGDTLAYRKMKDIFFYSGHIKEFLYHAIVMSDKHNFSSAYYDVYTILYSSHYPESKSSKLANYYLFKAYEENANHAESTIKERFGEKFKVPKSNVYWTEINQ